MSDDDLSEGERRALEMAAARGTSRPASNGGSAAAVGIAAFVGVPLFWLMMIFMMAGTHVSPLIGSLVAAVPPVLMLGAISAAETDHAGLAAASAGVGQALMSFAFGVYVAMGLDGHSEAASRFSMLPLFAPIPAYFVAAVVGFAIGEMRMRRKRVPGVKGKPE